MGVPKCGAMIWWKAVEWAVQEVTRGRTEEKLTEYTTGEWRAGPQRRGCPQEAVGEGCF